MVRGRSESGGIASGYEGTGGHGHGVASGGLQNEQFQISNIVNLSLTYAKLLITLFR